MSNEENTEMEGFELIAKASDTAEIRLFGDISQHTTINAKDFQNEIDKIKGKYSKLKIKIHSLGGSVIEGFLIFNIIKELSMEVEIQIMSVAASMGSIIALAGDKVSMYDNARIMIHQGSGGVAGTASQIKNYGNLLDKINNSLAEVYAKKTGKSVSWILQNWMSDGKDTWFTAKEAKASGLINEIIDHKKEALTAEYGDTMEILAQMTAEIPEARTYRDWIEHDPEGLEVIKRTNPEKFVALCRDEYSEEIASKIRKSLEIENSCIPNHTAPYDITKERSLVNNSQWTFSDWREKDSDGLNRMPKEDPEKFVALCHEEYGAEAGARIRAEILKGNVV